MPDLGSNKNQRSMILNEAECNNVFNSSDLPTKRAVAAILQELNTAKKKHPNWPSDAVYAAAVVSEESGELMRAALQFRLEDGNYEEMDKEAIQTGAMAVRFILQN